MRKRKEKNQEVTGEEGDENGDVKIMEKWL